MSIATEAKRIQQAKTDLKNTIEAKGITVDETALINTYASKVDEVYSAGYEKGKAEGNSLYDAFWDNYQQNGISANSFAYRFAGSGWTLETFKPKYDMIVNTGGNCSNMFVSSDIHGDLVEILKQQGVILDISKAVQASSTFRYSKFTRLGIIDLSSISTRNNSHYVLANMPNLETIDLFIPPKITVWNITNANVFTGTTSLKNITIGGTIYGNAPFSSCPLTTESMKSIITHLSNYIGTDKEFTCTVGFSTMSWEALDAEGATSPNNNTWREYINDIGWNVG